MAENINKVAELLRQAAAELSATGSNSDTNINTNNREVSVPPAESSQRSEEIRRIFSPYANNRGTGRSSGGASGSGSSSTSRPRWQPQILKRPTTPRSIKWAHKFLCLASPDQDYRPQKDSKLQLLRAGLGEKRIVFDKNHDAEHFKSTLFDAFPKLVEGGGFELLRSTDRYNLDIIPPSKNGYTSEYLADSCALGQSIVHIRPLQKELDINNTDFEPTTDCPTEICLICDESMPVINIKAHLKIHQDVDLPVIKKKKVDTPICKFACTQSTSSKNSEFEDSEHKEEKVNCPICGSDFHKDIILIHSATCSESVDDNQSIENNHAIKSEDSDTFDKAVEEIKKKINQNEKWHISVIRNSFERTSIDQLMEASTEDWKNQMFVKFINEEGVDAGGLTREFFSLLLKNKEIITPDEENFTLNPELLENEVYICFGRAVGLAILYGHPGPRCLNEHLCNFIIYEKIPKFNEVSNSDILRADAKAALKDIESATDENINDIFINNVDILNLTGFNKKLTVSNIKEALTAIKGYFLLYRTMAPLLQFIEGMKFLNILHILRKYPENGMLYLKKSQFATTEDILALYKPSYSTEEIKKIKEEIIVYNFEKFVKRLERGKITTPWLDLYDEEERIVTLTTKHLLQSLIGCEFVPATMLHGLFIFDHESEKITNINTCAPSITFTNVDTIQDYKKFEELFLNIIVCSYGFGQA